MRAHRFIPARAGNGSSGLFRNRAAGSVHPRACGERSRREITFDRLNRPVHPRACGERQVPDAIFATQGTGSSPRVRGTGCAARAVVRVVRGNRFIPARAGNGLVTIESRHPSTCHPVHPRACGERSNSGGGQLCQSATGSSPRVRGTGTTPTSSGRYVMAGSSPRVRGTGG